MKPILKQWKTGIVIMGVACAATQTLGQENVSLKQQRVDVLTEMVAAARGTWEFGGATRNDIYEAELRLFKAKLSMTTSAAEREALHKDMVARAEDVLSDARSDLNRGVLSKMDVLKLEANTLDLKIALEQIQSATSE